jgi:hypothetical protein
LRALEVEEGFFARDFLASEVPRFFALEAAPECFAGASFFADAPFFFDAAPFFFDARGAESLVVSSFTCAALRVLSPA